jgi:hypothetical protein
MATVMIIAGLIYLIFRLGAGHAHSRHRRAQGLSPNFYWSSGRGPYASVRLSGGFRVGHRHSLPAERVPGRMLAGGRILGSVPVSAPGALRHLQLCGVGHILEPRPVLACAPAEVNFRLAKYPNRIP